jgi:hypothetical protein
MKYKKKPKIVEKFEFLQNEIFKEISLGEDDDKLQLRYAISNYGRLVSFSHWDDLAYGRIIKGSKTDGYRTWHYTVRDENNKKRYKHRFYYRLVAEYFLPKTSTEQVYVLHLDRKRDNDKVENLKWATRSEMLAHSKKSPYVIAAKKDLKFRLAKIRYNQKKSGVGNKLTSTQVIRIKKMLLDPERKTRLKIIARRFGVTEMTLQRIKTGENWGHIKV